MLPHRGWTRPPAVVILAVAGRGAHADHTATSQQRRRQLRASGYVVVRDHSPEPVRRRDVSRIRGGDFAPEGAPTSNTIGESKMTAPPQTHTDVPLVWDAASAVAAVGGDRGLALDLLAELIASLSAELGTFEQLLETEQLDRLAERAHRCQGGAAYCGVPALIAALAELDKSARTGSRSQTEQAMTTVAAAIANLQQLDLDTISR